LGWVEWVEVDRCVVYVHGVDVWFAGTDYGGCDRKA